MTTQKELAATQTELATTKTQLATTQTELGMAKTQEAEMKAEVAALKDTIRRLQEEWRQQRVALGATPERRTPQSDTPTSAPPVSPPAPLVFPAPPVHNSSVFSRVSRQHANIVLKELRPEDYESINRRSNNRVDRYGSLLFRSVISNSTYKSWCLNTNWDGSRGKCELPKNLKQFIVTTLQQRFPGLTPVDEKNFVSRINEALRTPRNNVEAGV